MARPGIEPRTSDLRVRCPSDCATQPGYKHNEDVHMIFSKQENNFVQNYGILDLDKFQVRFQYWVASLCNQLLPEFSNNLFETFHRI